MNILIIVFGIRNIDQIIGIRMLFLNDLISIRVFSPAFDYLDSVSLNILLSQVVLHRNRKTSFKL